MTPALFDRFLNAERGEQLLADFQEEQGFPIDVWDQITLRAERLSTRNSDEQALRLDEEVVEVTDIRKKKDALDAADKKALRAFLSTIKEACPLPDPLKQIVCKYCLPLPESFFQAPKPPSALAARKAKRSQNQIQPQKRPRSSEQNRISDALGAPNKKPSR